MKIKFYETTFDEYLNKKKNLHPNLHKLTNLVKNKNIIFYGPPGIGKYTQVLNYIKTESSSNLKYERKLNITLNKKQYMFKISDIHFEVDMQILGCNAKILWNKLYYLIIDIVSSRENKKGIIICKNFQNIHTELLDIFYSYMQTLHHRNININYIFITEQVSFIPDNILNRCSIIPIKRPSKTTYNKCLKNKIQKDFNINNIKNIKQFYLTEKNINSVFHNICKKIIQNIIQYKKIVYLQFRDNIYDMFIYQLDISECIWYIISELIEKNHIKDDHISEILLKSNVFFKFFNNNYRPIYHIENLLFFIIKKIHGF
jgi:DNA polymerase III delta prime subunit